MTISDVVFATGVCRQTVYKHIQRGDLDAYKDDAGRWCVSDDEVYSWACWLWEHGLCVMYPPENVKNNILYRCGQSAIRAKGGRRGRHHGK